MENRPSLDTLRTELKHRGLPRAYIERLLSELDDHYTDLLEERSTSMGAARKLQPSSVEVQQQLGDPTQLAIYAAEQYHARSFWGRHPLVTFLITPLPLFAVCWLAFGVAIGLVLSAIRYGVNALGWTEWVIANLDDYVYLEATLFAFLCWYITVLPPLTAAWILCRTCRRNVLDWHWPVLGCAILAVVAGLHTATYDIMTDTNKSALSLGFEVRGSADWLLSFLSKFALAFSIGLLLVKRAQQQLQLDV
jgi:hypothetical protein